MKLKKLADDLYEVTCVDYHEELHLSEFEGRWSVQVDGFEDSEWDTFDEAVKRVEELLKEED